MRCPLTDPHRFEVSIITDDSLWVKDKEPFFFLIKHHALIHTGSFHLGQFRDPSPVTGQVQAVAIHPAMIGAFTPTGSPIQVAQLLGDPIDSSVRLMPYRSLRFEQAGVLDQ